MATSHDDVLDRLFFECLTEIQKSYSKFPKQIRLRIEKWCEKLAGSGGSNKIWRRSRNDYAKLLLGMIVSNKFSEPFHVMPQDGPLPTFPSYLKPKLKESLGPHESAFWRHLYNGIEDSSRHAGTRTKQNLDKDEVLSRFNGTLSDQKEIQSLSLLAREQEQRILVLEQELRDERLSHELEMQRIIYAHRVEVAKGGQSYMQKYNNENSRTQESFLGKFPSSSGMQDDVHSVNSLDRASLSSFDLPSVISNEHTAPNETEDEDFLAYIERFQQEIKHISLDR